MMTIAAMSKLGGSKTKWRRSINEGITARVLMRKSETLNWGN